MFIVEIWVYCGPPWKFEHPKILQLPILGSQFLNTGLDRAGEYCKVYLPSYGKSQP